MEPTQPAKPDHTKKIIIIVVVIFLLLSFCTCSCIGVATYFYFNQAQPSSPSVELQALTEESIAIQPATPTPTPAPAVDPAIPDNLKASMAQVDAIKDAFVADSARGKKLYEDTLTAIGWDDLLDPKRIAADKDLSQSRKIIDSSRKVVETYQKTLRDKMSKYKADILAVKIPGPEQATFRRAFESTLATTWENTQRVTALELKIVNAVGDLFDFLEAKPRTWTIIDDQFNFEKDADLAKFNAFLATMQKYVQEQNALMNDSAADKKKPAAANE
jgi:hypothetical protein